MDHPFRFGVSISNAASAEDWRTAARKAEDLGYSTFSVADHIRGSFQPMVALAAAAEATKTIRIGTLVINNDFRHPVLLGREAATLDVLSGGRLELGMGAGHSGDEYREFGIPFHPPAVRVARLAESIQIMKRLWHEEEASFEGEHYQVRNHKSYPRPVQTPIPILIGGNGRSLLEVAAREADIVGFTGFLPGEDGRAKAFPHFSAETFGDRINVVRNAAGARFASLELNVLVQGVDTSTPRDSAESWAQGIEGFSAEEIAGSPFVLFGSESQLIDKLLLYRDRFGISYYTTFGPGIDTLAPIVAKLAGK